MVASAVIKSLLSGEIVAGSRISGKLLDELMSEGLLTVIVRGSRKSYRASNVESLMQFLIDKDERYKQLDKESFTLRASMAADTGNSKIVMVRSCPGFPVNSYESINCWLNGIPFVVNPQEGSFLFVTDWHNFKIPKDVVIIGIENMENFRKIRNQRQFFQNYLEKRGLSKKVLFVSRYPQSTDLRNWLQEIPNHYYHFGDFDLAGINIFISEFMLFVGSERSTFLIPDDISYRLSFGSSQRYDEQYNRFKNLKSEIGELQKLIDLIHKERKCYDQEGYIDYFNIDVC